MIAAENIDLRAFGVDLHNLRLRQDLGRPRLDLDGSRRLFADIVEARLPASGCGQGRAASGSDRRPQSCANSPTCPRIASGFSLGGDLLDVATRATGRMVGGDSLELPTSWV